MEQAAQANSPSLLTQLIFLTQQLLKRIVAQVLCFSCFNSKWCNARLSIIDNGTERKDMWHTCCGEYHANYIYHNLTEIVPLNSGSQVYLNIYKDTSEEREAYYRYYIMRLTTYMS